MVRGAAIGFVVSMLLTTVATLLMLSGTVHAQQAPQHVFSGLVQNHKQSVHQGRVLVLDMSGLEVAGGDIRGGRFKIAVVEPAGRNYSGQTFQIAVDFEGRIYERGRPENWQAGGVTELTLNIEGWRWHQAPPQGDYRRIEQNDEDRARKLEEEERRIEQNDEDRDRRMEMDDQRMEMERQRMEMESEMRREQMEMERQRMGMEGDMREKEGEERREMEEEMRREQMEMERQRMEREDKSREKEGEERRELEKQRMEREDEDRALRMKMEEEMRREQMEMERQRMGRDQPGVQPIAGERPKGGPSRGLFSNRAAGEATSGVDNIMDPTMLTIIGIVLTVLTTGMTLFKGD